MVVDPDLEKFFDKVNHDVLMARLKRKISHKRLLYYIRQMLKAGVIDERGMRHEREEGTPQGRPLSPLLANVLPDDFDKEPERRGRLHHHGEDHGGSDTKEGRKAGWMSKTQAESNQTQTKQKRLHHSLLPAR